MTHPIGINLSPIPGDHVLRQQPTAESVLRTQAVELHAWMRCEAEDYIRFCEAYDAYAAAKIPVRYRVLVLQYEALLRAWHECNAEGMPHPEIVHHTLMANVRDILREREKVRPS